MYKLKLKWVCGAQKKGIQLAMVNSNAIPLSVLHSCNKLHFYKRFMDFLK